MATIKDVAREAGVSTATVSRVVNNYPKVGETSKKLVQLAIAKLGYRPNANARALVNKCSETIGVLVSDISDPFFGCLIQAVDQVARENNKHLLIGNGYDDQALERAAIEILINSCRESLIIHAKALTDEELINFAKEVPGLVLINRYIPELAERCISFDSVKGTYIATEFLIKNGHKNIAYINSNHKIEDAVHRKKGYLQALKDNNISCADDYIVEEDGSGDGGSRAMINLLSRNIPITAVLVYNDFMAVGVLSALEDNHIAVPGEISVVGFDNLLISQCVNPKLTTINYPIKKWLSKQLNFPLSALKKKNIVPKRVFSIQHLLSALLFGILIVSK